MASTEEGSALTVSADVESAESAASAQEFAALGLGPQALHAVIELSYTAPTPIQRLTIPPLPAGRDVIAQAPTGTGKTAAYGLPIVERLDEGELTPQALIIVPTRKLAMQVAAALQPLARIARS